MGKCTVTRVVVIGLFLSWVALQFTPVAVRSIEALRGNGASAQPEEQYTCGVFGEWIYRFPYSVFGGLAEYVGDDPWSPGFSRKNHGCTDELVGQLFRMCWPDLMLANFYTADSGKCFVVGVMAAPGKDDYIENILTIKKPVTLVLRKIIFTTSSWGCIIFTPGPLRWSAYFGRKTMTGFRLLLGCAVLMSAPRTVHLRRIAKYWGVV